MLQYQTAQTEIAAHFKTYWENAITVGIPGEFGPLVLLSRGSNVPYTPKIQWSRVEPISEYSPDKHWLRFNTQDTISKQDTFAKDDVKAIHENKGLIAIQLFFSKASFSTSDTNKIKRICQKAFQRTKTPSGVWFRNSTIIDLAEENVFFRTNVTAEYVYDSRN